MFSEKAKIKLRSLLKLALIVFAIVIYSIGLKWFVNPANIIPAGFTGMGVLLQKFFYAKFGIDVGLTVFNVSLNLIPAIFAYKIVGKKFTIISFIIMAVFTFISDLLPVREITSNPLLGAIFGGILCGFAASIWFRCGVSGGGTDFIALSLSAKYHIQTFSYIMIFNIILIVIQAILYGFEPALYSIIYQYVSTQAINTFYRHYEARTIFIITEKPTLVSKMLIKESGHSATKFDGVGCYTMNNKSMLYMVVTKPEVKKVISIVKKCDPTSFINVMMSDQVQGNFKYLPVDIDDIDENY